MKLIFACFLLLSTSVSLACSCEYDYGSRSMDFMNRAANLIGDVEGKDLKIIRYDLEFTAMARFDPTAYGRYSCGCTSFVRRVWDLSYEKNGAVCDAQVILQVWNDKMKLKSEKCE